MKLGVKLDMLWGFVCCRGQHVSARLADTFYRDDAKQADVDRRPAQGAAGTFKVQRLSFGSSSNKSLKTSFVFF